ncbi:MAG: hypothetical protein WCP95_10700 [Actinomycetes bacterium]
MMRIIRVLAVLGATGLALALPATAASAADATGCSGSVVSKNAAGETIGTASAPGEGGTQADPLPIDTAGKVAWKGSTDSVITGATWKVTAAGATFLQGTYANSDGVTASAGVQDMSALPAVLGTILTNKMAVPVSGEITGTGGTCTASGFITGVVAPTSSPVFYAGAVAGVIGVAMGAGVIAGTKALAAPAAAAGGGGVA